ncbi:hypothetical protein HC022_14990 [Salipiger sp. HF18]|uniref:hypothetical protein n=1 Tax=Salipiger sp. HF18 TaxID=2721557 RepID=UPI00142E2FAA|nr:hypothetical protein [Salipiger sp. HF18]NIY97502.1 hypothetical protein [Salipiger sp. HF18]
MQLLHRAALAARFPSGTAQLIAPLQAVAPEVLGPQHTLRVEMEGKLRAVHVDPVKLGAALLGLISNAREALIGGGELVLRSAPGRGGAPGSGWSCRRHRRGRRGRG